MKRYEKKSQTIPTYGDKNNWSIIKSRDLLNKHQFERQWSSSIWYFISYKVNYSRGYRWCRPTCSRSSLSGMLLLVKNIISCPLSFVHMSITEQKWHVMCLESKIREDAWNKSQLRCSVTFLTVSQCSISKKCIHMNMEIFTGKIWRPDWRRTRAVDIIGEENTRWKRPCRICRLLKSEKFWKKTKSYH